LILESKQKVFFIKRFNLLLGTASKSNFWQYFNFVRKGNVIDFEIETKSIFLLKPSTYY